jgi:hypothetical protein
MGPRRRQDREHRRDLRLKVVLALYLLAAALLPLAHHDVVCHAKSPTHCSTCVAGSSLEAADNQAQLARGILQPGDCVGGDPAALVSVALSICSGRAPPSPLA